MSHKIAKLARHSIRQYMRTLPVTKYVEGPQGARSFVSGFNPNGTERLSAALITGTIRLADACQKRQKTLLVRKLREHERRA